MSTTQNRTVYVNGAYVHEADAKVSIFDRGYLMADAVYEFTATRGGKLIHFAGHMARMQRSLNELSINYKVDHGRFLEIHRELVKRNNLDVGGVYLQISRGVADRDFAFPTGLAPSIIAFTQDLDILKTPVVETGLKVISVDDARWQRRDIKSVQLLATSMAKTQANQQSVDDAIFVKDGFVTEATSANVFIVTDGCVMTRQLSNDLLHGITRQSMLELAEAQGLGFEVRPFTVEEAQNADEVFMTASPLYAISIVEIDGKPIGDGKPGEVCATLREAFLKEAIATAV